MALENAKFSDPRQATFDILMIHGGGSAGGFAAGFLDGWAEVNDPYFARPEFDYVTGSSSGSLVAPFAFVGSKEAYKRSLELAEQPPTWREPNLFSFWPTRKSILNNKNLVKLVQKEFDAQTIAQIAQGGEQHKSLLIATTDMDLGLGYVWDLAIEAKIAKSTGDPKRLHDILLASTALPPAFPAIEIDGVLYADGGIAASLFLAIDLEGFKWLADAWRERHPGTPMPAIRVWAIINQKLLIEGETVQPQYTDIGMRSINIMMQYDRFKALMYYYHMIERVNALDGVRAEFRYITIPDNATIPLELTDLIDNKLVTGLVNLGRQLGADPLNWKKGPPNPLQLPAVGTPTDVSGQ
jgi:predicted acylesterase/phospholipase RssA